jgi:hypothetical protein
MSVGGLRQANAARQVGASGTCLMGRMVTASLECCAVEDCGSTEAIEPYRVHENRPPSPAKGVGEGVFIWLCPRCYAGVIARHQAHPRRGWPDWAWHGR